MTFDDYQKAALTTAVYPQEAKIFYPALGLCGEVGEVALQLLYAVCNGPIHDLVKRIVINLDNASRAASECEALKKTIRDKGGYLPPDALRSVQYVANGISDHTKGEIMRELGDVLWYVAAMAHDLGFTLSEVAADNLEKLRDRMNRNVIKGQGDNR